MSKVQEAREFGLLVPTCARFGISKTSAFAYARRGLIEVFRIGRRTYCYVDSVLALPSKIGKPGVNHDDACVAGMLKARGVEAKPATKLHAMFGGQP